MIHPICRNPPPQESSIHQSTCHVGKLLTQVYAAADASGSVDETSIMREYLVSMSGIYLNQKLL